MKQFPRYFSLPRVFDKAHQGIEEKEKKEKQIKKTVICPVTFYDIMVLWYSDNHH